MHHLLEDTFLAALHDVWKYAKKQIGNGTSDESIRAWLHKRRLDQHAGGFNFRKITAGKSLSLHPYGIDIDWDAEHNQRKKPADAYTSGLVI